MQKNAELVDRSQSLLAMVCPPFWFLNQRMPEAALASILAFFVALTVHWILGVVFYLMLCIYSGREQGNMLIAFMSFRKFLYLQTIVAENELNAQRTVLSLDSEMFFKEYLFRITFNEMNTKEDIFSCHFLISIQIGRKATH